MKKLIALTLALLMLILPLASCAEKTPDVVRVYTLNGTTGFGMAKMMQDNKDNEGYTFEVKTDASDVTAALIAGTVDIAALPTNAAANVYNKPEGGVKVIAVNTLGCLYLLTKEGTTVTSLSDLQGKTVYVPAQNPTFILTDLCKQNNLTDVNIDSTTYAKPDALRDAVAQGVIDVAVLPEPMVTVALSSAKKSGVNWTNAMDLTAEWDKVHPAGSLVQGCVVVRTAFLEQYPAAVEAFLREYKASIEYLTQSPKEASEMIVSAGIFANAAVAEKAIPRCNVCYLDGADMKAKMQVYLAALEGINPASIGGKLPDDGFYYVAK